ncbi:MAG: long-chain fatty acid--CoA ligase [Rhodospirillaceae bacterium]|nr:long-chain fatty acid--CoA ligase [Rhodospirillaceae bacterium]
MHLTHGLTRAALQRPDALALICEDRRRTYRQFADRVARLAGAFRGFGLKPGDRVSILALNSDRYVEYYFATIWAGGIIAPINTRWSTPEMVECVEDCTPAILLADSDHAEQARALARQCDCIHHLIHADEGTADGFADYETLIAETEPVEDARRSDDDIACLFYTGGTTGRSKGVILTHANLAINALHTIPGYGYDETTVALHAGPLFHLAAGSRIFTNTIAMGCHVVMRRFSGANMLSLIETEKITSVVLVPTMIAMLLEMPEFKEHDLSSLSHLSYGAAPMPEALLARLMRALPHTKFAHSYGMTETSPLVSTLPHSVDDLDGPLAAKLRTAGRAVFDVDIRIADDDGRNVATGQVGEILLRGPTITPGYWQRPDLTAEALRDGWLHTGDLGYLDEDQYLTVVDRKKDMIISGGENIYSAEVENALHLHPAIAECAVIGLPDERWGERVHAVVRLENGTAIAAEDLIEHCRGLIAHYKCPREIEFSTEPLPKSGPGKILKSALREWQRT